jgi:hypothetical protein
MIEIYWYPLIISVFVSGTWYRVGDFRFLSADDEQYIHYLVDSIIYWCNANLGEKSTRLKVEVLKDNSPENPDLLGQYILKSKTIRIFPKACASNVLLTEIVMHDFVHYLHDLRSYNKYDREFGYLNNPLEIEVRKVSKALRWKFLYFCHENIKLKNSEIIKNYARLCKMG